jgi:hypothetical protein
VREAFCIKCGLSDPTGEMVPLYDDVQPLQGETEPWPAVWVHRECLRRHRGAEMSFGMVNLERYMDEQPKRR